MTEYGWDASSHDWPRGPMNLTQARVDGIHLFTHKSSEGSTFTDPKFDAAMTRAQGAGFPVVGAYHVLWPNNAIAQADYWLNRVNTFAPWWRNHPCWIFQIDAELFQNFSPYRPPTVGEINACGDRIVGQSGCAPSQVVVYAPEWLYGSGLGGLRYRCLWASSYVSGSGGFKTLYTKSGGDASFRWDAYSGIHPTILQYTSSATIAGQAPADANAIRVNSAAALQHLFLGEVEDMATYNDWTQAEKDALADKVVTTLLAVNVTDDRKPTTDPSREITFENRVGRNLGRIGDGTTDVSGSVRDTLNEVNLPGTNGTWKSAFENLYSRTGTLAGDVDTVQTDVATLTAAVTQQTATFEQQLLQINEALAQLQSAVAALGGGTGGPAVPYTVTGTFTGASVPTP